MPLTQPRASMWPCSAATDTASTRRRSRRRSCGERSAACDSSTIGLGRALRGVDDREEVGRVRPTERDAHGVEEGAGSAFLNEVSCVPLQQGLRHLQGAYANFFAKRAKYPSFKKKARGGSAEFSRSAFRFEDSALTLAKMVVPLDVRWSRPLPKNAEPSTVTVSLDAAGRWHVSLLCEDATVKPLPKLKTVVGIDLGITALATLSTGEKIHNPRHDERESSQKRRLSKALARTPRTDFNNRDKVRLKLARLHARIADRRRDNLHKLTTRLVRENQAIIVEDLNVAGMVRNHLLARVISDAAWRMMLTFLAYKCAWYGRTFVKSTGSSRAARRAPPAGTSSKVFRSASASGHVPAAEPCMTAT